MHHYLAPQIYGEKSNRAELKEHGFTDALWKEPVTSVSVAIAYELRSTYGSWLNASDPKGIYESFGKARWAAEMRRQRGRRWEIFQRPCLVAESNRAIAALILLGDCRGSYLKNINYGKRISLGAIAACWDIPGADGTYVSIPSHQCDCGRDFLLKEDFCSLCG
ncbi:MAG: hypothetical protein VX704_07495 [Verrucomicrobiota bacterium]|nr:hypothetical protein [Verrucomicrobiota bacterium]